MYPASPQNYSHVQYLLRTSLVNSDLALCVCVFDHLCDWGELNPGLYKHSTTELHASLFLF